MCGRIIKMCFALITNCIIAQFIYCAYIVFAWTVRCVLWVCVAQKKLRFASIEKRVLYNYRTHRESTTHFSWKNKIVYGFIGAMLVYITQKPLLASSTHKTKEINGEKNDDGNKTERKITWNEHWTLKYVCV